MKFPFLIFFIFTIIFTANSNSLASPKPKNGILDLRGWDFQRDGIVDLNGEWEFYLNKFILKEPYPKMTGLPLCGTIIKLTGNIYHPKAMQHIV